MKKTGKRILGLFLAVLMLVGLAVPTGIMAPTARAEGEEEEFFIPEHSKSVKSNGDGTYTIELTVTGDADPDPHVSGAVNVIVVFDASDSMLTNYTDDANTITRADAAENVIYKFAQDLFAYQDKGADVEMALVTFNHDATTVQGWTDTASKITGILSADGTAGSYKLGTAYDHGTNWEAALQALTNETDGLLTKADENRTFVIFVTDGAPSQYVGSNFTGGYTNDDTGRRQCYDHTKDEAQAIQQYNTDSNATESNTTMYGIYAYGEQADFLDDLMYYSLEGQHYGGSLETVVGTTAANAADYNYFKTSDTNALASAIAQIFQEIADFLGVAEVTIDDGTTSDVTAASGDVYDLLEIDEESYQYWLTIPVNSANKFSRLGADNKTTEYTVKDNGDGTCTVTWDSGSVTVDGSIEDGSFKYEWKLKNTDDDALYEKEPPEAKLVGSSVKWDLSSVGTLLTGVTYSVTFEVYPSQTTLDYIADLKNGKSIPADVQAYIHEDGSFETNTTASLSFKDTRTGETHDGIEFNPVKPQSADAVKQLTVAKEWKNELDPDEHAAEEVTLDVLRDGKKAYEVVLNDGNKFKNDVFISIGIINKKGKVVKGSEGHDFTFSEPDETSFYWELDIPTVHPMMINGEPTILIKVDGKHPAPDEATTYTINGSQYYVDESTFALTAVNERRSSVNLIKEVDGEDIPEDTVFPFTLTVTNSLAPEEEPENDSKHESDWWVWISVRDGQGENGGNPVTDAVVSGATHDGKGWYYAPSGAVIELNVKNGYSIRLNNLPSGSTYSFAEGDLSKLPGFLFKEASIKLIKGKSPTDEFGYDAADQEVHGEIEATNVVYQVTVTNQYALIDINVDKIWDDADDQDGMRPDELELTLNGAPEGVDIPDPEIEKDGNTWTYTWKGVPRYDLSSAEIKYTVTEEEVPEGYDCDEKTAEDGGTITNTHKTENISVTVTKVWEDNDDQDGKRPDKLDLTLNGVPEGVNTPDPEIKKDGNTWTYTWSGLPEKNNGETIKYTVTETAVPEGYTCGKNEVDAGGTITNTHTAETVDVTVTKVWDDEDDKDGKRPESLELTLEGLPEGVTAPEPKVTKDGSKWTYTWSGLPKYSAGEEIAYTVTEDEDKLPEGYKASGSPAEAGGTITNSYTPGVQELRVQKVWNDGNDKDKLRPDSIDVKLILNGKKCDTQTLSAENEWKCSWTIPVSEDLVYTVDEDVVPKGYVYKITGDVETGFTITNTHETTPTPPPPVTTIRIEIVKVWEDNSNASGIRTDTVQVMLLKGGVTNLTRTLGDSNEWKYEGYVEGGYDYSVIETPVEGYESIVTQSPIPGGIRFTVVNKLTNTPALNTEDHVAYIVGYPDGTVRPDKEITRAEVATIFFRLLTDEARDAYWSQTNPYPDVAPDAWYNNAISTLTKMGIINGYEDGTFRPNNPITRAELTKMAVSFFSSADQYFGKTPSFSDVPADAWYTRFIAAAEELGLINGYPDGTFRPANNITRAETCTIVNRTLGRGPHKDHLLPYAEMINWPDNTPDAWYYAQIQEASNSHDYDWITEQIENTTVEQWTAKLEERDWVALEQVWSTSHSAPGGEVMG